MWRGNVVRFLILALAGVVLSPCCATLTRKRTQRIPVASSPAGERATAFRLRYEPERRSVHIGFRVAADRK